MGGGVCVYVCVCVYVWERKERQCVCLRVCVVTGCSSKITATWTIKDIDLKVLL